MTKEEFERSLRQGLMRLSEDVSKIRGNGWHRCCQCHEADLPTQMAADAKPARRRMRPFKSRSWSTKIG